MGILAAFHSLLSISCIMGGSYRMNFRCIYGSPHSCAYTWMNLCSLNQI